METESELREDALGAELALAACTPRCGVERTLQVLDGKWSTLVVRYLLDGPKRFGELRADLGNPSAKTLTDRLRSLEHHGVLTRTVYPEIPPRVVYELTDRGRSLQTVLYAMLRWGDEHAGPPLPGHPVGGVNAGDQTQ